MTKFQSLKKQYQKAVKRLDEILKKRKNKIIRDSAIKRFEFTFDLAWKTIKAFLEEEKGIRCISPKECFREAYRQGLIEYDEIWLKMTDWRNSAVHTYSEKFADDLYKKLPECLKLFKELLANLES
ncbi:nucleotidyltransferase substrate binding protein [bacterium]|nr:nucleotidyltransferase substrate binding protein [bacterium]